MKLHNCEHSILLILPRQDRKIAKGLLFYPSYKHKETKDYCCKKRLRNDFESKKANYEKKLIGRLSPTVWHTSVYLNMFHWPMRKNFGNLGFGDMFKQYH